MSSRRFDDQSYLNEFMTTGRFPRIHDDVMALVSGTCPVVPAMDFGSCIGLLSIRLVVEFGAPMVVGIEPKKKNFDRAAAYPNVVYYNMSVDREHIDALETIIIENDIRLLVARRVISEIGYNNVDFMRVLTNMMADSGISDIVLEGRVFSVRATHPIPNSDAECRLLESRYHVVDEYKSARHLVLK